MEINRVTNMGISPAQVTSNPTAAEAVKSFSTYLADSLEEVNRAQVESAALTDKFAAGQVQDIHQVMIASQKSSLMLQMTMQVRNKIIESYQEIMRMSL